MRLGLLFQVTDDILDETGSFEEMGKGIAKDRARGKWTYPVAHGMPAAIERASELERAALDAVRTFGPEAGGEGVVSRLRFRGGAGMLLAGVLAAGVHADEAPLKLAWPDTALASKMRKTNDLAPAGRGAPAASVTFP